MVSTSYYFWLLGLQGIVVLTMVAHLNLLAFAQKANGYFPDHFFFPEGFRIPPHGAEGAVEVRAAY